MKPRGPFSPCFSGNLSWTPSVAKLVISLLARHLQHLSRVIGLHIPLKGVLTLLSRILEPSVGNIGADVSAEEANNHLILGRVVLIPVLGIGKPLCPSFPGVLDFVPPGLSLVSQLLNPGLLNLLLVNELLHPTLRSVEVYQNAGLVLGHINLGFVVQLAFILFGLPVPFQETCKDPQLLALKALLAGPDNLAYLLVMAFLPPFNGFCSASSSLLRASLACVSSSFFSGSSTVTTCSLACTRQPGEQHQL